MAGFSYLLNPKIVDIPKSHCTLNIFEAHIKSDTVVFGYTATDGTQKDFKFPLAGFKEKYLEQFI